MLKLAAMLTAIVRIYVCWNGMQHAWMQTQTTEASAQKGMNANYWIQVSASIDSHCYFTLTICTNVQHSFVYSLLNISWCFHLTVAKMSEWGFSAIAGYRKTILVTVKGLGISVWIAERMYGMSTSTRKYKLKRYKRHLWYRIQQHFYISWCSQQHHS